MENNEMLSSKTENSKIVLMEKVMHLAMLLRRLSAPRFAGEGVRGLSQARALTQIALRDGIGQRELMEKLGIQPSSLSELLGKLEKAGMIERRASEDDRRQVNVFISESGRRYLERVNDEDQNLIPFDALSDEEAESFMKIIEKLIASAENACADKGLPLYPPRPGERGFMPGAPMGPRPPRPDARAPFAPHRPPFPGERPPFPVRPDGRFDENNVERGSDYKSENHPEPFRRPRPFRGGPVRLPNMNPSRDSLKSEPLTKEELNKGIQLADGEEKHQI